MANRWSWFEKLVSRPSGVVVVVTLMVMFLAAVEGIGILAMPGKRGAFVGLISCFGLVGVFLGAVYATEIEAGAEKNRPVARTLICSCVGAAVAYVAQAPFAWSVLIVLSAGFLGWLGMRWVRYVDC